MLGISVYLQDLDINYINQAAAIGAKYIFTSLHIPEEDFSDIDVKLPQLIEASRKNNMRLVPDISPVTFEKLGIEPSNIVELKKMGFQTLRLDYGFDDFEKIKNLQRDFELILNASIVDESYILKAKSAGINFQTIKVAHNFYPKTNTALGIDYFAELNRTFVKYNIQILAFVPGDLLKRFPLYEGLPTVEKHRGKNPFVSAVELIHKYEISDIMIGDSFAKLSTLEKIQNYMKHKVLIIPTFFEADYMEMYDTLYKPRKDMPENVIRLATPRINDIPIKTTAERKRGTITMENKLSGRYSGEIQICKTDLPMDAGANVIGFVHPDYIDLLEYVDRDTKIKFEQI